MLTTIAQAVPEGPDPLAPQTALLLIAAGFLIVYALYRLSNVDTLRRFRPYILVGILALWGLTVIELAFAIAHAITDAWFLMGLFILTVFAATNFQWMRNATAGLALEFEDRLSIGDSIRVGEYQGTIVRFGLRAVRIRGPDGRNHDVPNRKLVDESVSNLASGRDAACEITVAIPDDLDAGRAREVARQAALLSPLASPRHEPEIFVEVEGPTEGRPKLRVRAFAAEAAHQDQYRSDVTRRLLREFRRPEGPSTGETHDAGSV